MRDQDRKGHTWLAAGLLALLAGCAGLSSPRVPVVAASQGGVSVAAEPGEADSQSLQAREPQALTTDADEALLEPVEEVRDVQGPAPAGLTPAYCRNLYDALEGQIRSRQLVDAGEQRLPGYPFLRTNRFLASFGAEFESTLAASKLSERQAQAASLLKSPAFQAWLAQMQRLDSQVRHLEASRLPAQAFPLYQLADRHALLATLDQCAPLLTAELTPADVPRILAEAKVPDEYQRSLRALGLYPITGIGVASSIRNWEVHQREVFQRQRHPDFSGRAAFQRYRPAKTPSGADAWRTAAKVMQAVQRDALGIPKFLPAQRDALFEAFAPTFEVATVNDSDRIGRLQWIDLAGLVRDPRERFWLDVDTNVPAVYRQLTFTRFGKAVLPQLVYTIWFSERPMESGSDMLGGRLDGLVWRVTLDEDGAPLIFDSIQPSGRFAMFFPTRRLMPDAQARANVDSLVEWVYSPIDVAIEDWVGETWPGPLSLHVSSRTHQLVGIAAPGKAWGTPVFDNPPYQLVSADVLRALPVPGDGRRSIYNQDGIVSGTERLGRWLLWSMGISNMGAIRQPGHQPTALVGRRHFDDPYLFQKRYRRVPVPEAGKR